MTLISVSVLSANFANLKSELELIEKAGADKLHLDIMDGNYVPNISFGHDIVNTIHKNTKLPLDVHLMVSTPEKWIEVYANSGASFITIHPETTLHLSRTIAQIKKVGCKVGIALLPASPISILEYIIDEIDLILVMSVNPGFGGQKFMSSQLKKISQITELIKGRDIILSVDGGINHLTGADCVKNGAHMLVSGSYIFNGDYAKNIACLKDAGK
ncbi:MAG: ribulose-phosphate 3-epimerase [Rickettsiaceae bacterium]|nr:ribulose-phosphate 3-epimerase [Rickettsiaceae bacterium]